MQALYAAQANYAQELRNIRFGLDILDLAIDPPRYVAAINGNYYHALDPIPSIPELYCAPRPKKNEVDQDSQSPLYKTDDFRIFHFKVRNSTVARSCFPYVSKLYS